MFDDNHHTRHKCDVRALRESVCVCGREMPLEEQRGNVKSRKARNM